MKLPFERFLSYGMNRAYLALMPPLLDGFAALGLHAREAAILWVVGANPDCSQIDIARALGVQRTNLVPIIGKLVRVGVLDRRRSDGRTYALTLSATGQDLLKQIEGVASKHEERFFAHLSSDDRRRLSVLWHDLCAKAEGEARG